MAAGDTLRRITQQDQLVLDSSGNLVGLKNPNATGADLRYDPATAFKTIKVKTALQAAVAPPAVMSVAPTITTQASFANSTIPSYVFVAANGPSVYWHGLENISTVTTAALNDGVQHGFFAPTVPFSGSPFPVQTGVLFDGLQLDLLFFSNPGQAWSAQFLIDGQIYSAAYPANAGGGGASRFIVTLTFATRKMRSICMVAACSGFAGFYVAPTDTIGPADTASMLKFAFTGDSYMQASSVGIAPLGISQQVALSLGTVFSTVDAVGGTGYQTRNGGTGNGINNFVDRLSAPNRGTFANPVPDIHVTCGGINDVTLTSSQTASYFAGVRALFPSAILVATGPWCPVGTQAPDASGSKYPTLRDAIKAGLAQVSGPWVFIDNLKNTWTNSSGVTAAATDSTTWQTGSGRVGATTGSGNGDVYIQADATHPTTAGVDYLTARLAANIRAAVLALG